MASATYRGAAPASGFSILVLDDEALIAYDVAALVEGMGHAVLGPCVALDEAEAAATNAQPDFAILDIDIDGRPVWPFARQLRSRGCGILFVSANRHHAELRDEFAECFALEKPADPAAISAIIAERAAA